MSRSAPGAPARRPRGRAPAEPAAVHPLEDSERLAQQATAAVGLLERFGDLVIVALEAVGSGNDDALRTALTERERLMAELEPVLAALAAARHSAAATAGQNARAAVATILKPVDEALRHARLLHIRLADEVEPRAEAPRVGLTLVR